MKSNLERRKEIGKGILPPLGTKEYFDKINELKEIETHNPWIKEFHKNNWKKVKLSLEAQYLSNCDFITEKTLRQYLMELNNRAWNHGLRSMPIMFNIMEAYFNFRKPEVYFELIEEENYLISFFDFIDFITSSDFKDNRQLIEENITSDLIYNFNIGKDIEKIKFKTTNGDAFIVSGVSIIRRDNEVTVLAITGRENTSNLTIDENEFNFSNDNPNKTKLIKEFKETLKNKKIEFEFIDNEKKYIKVLVACRLDLDTMSIDARYVAEETNLTFDVMTDEVDGFLDLKGEFRSEEIKKTYINSKKGVEEFNAIFEIIKYSLYLPYYFNSKENIIVEERLDTEFKKQYSNPVAKRKYKDVLGFKCSSKPLYSLDEKKMFSPNTIMLREDLFKVRSSGYWKKLQLDEVGIDKKGNPIHGRTWVNQNLSWFEAKEEDLIVEKKFKLFLEKNAGFIYILRNPTLGKNIFKIGLTRNDVNDRINQLSNTSIPEKYYKCQEWQVRDCIKAEKVIHAKLEKYRVDPRREFFQIEYEEAIKVIMEVVLSVNHQ
jgi:hypothetical protein